jgi:hypothetical protein
MVQGQATHQLHVEVAHLHHTLAGLAHHGKGLGQQGFKGLALCNALFEGLGLRLELVVAELLKLRLQAVDALHRLAIGLQQAVVAATKYFGEEVCGHTCGPAPDTLWIPGRQMKVGGLSRTRESKRRETTRDVPTSAGLSRAKRAFYPPLPRPAQGLRGPGATGLAAATFSPAARNRWGS